MLRSSVLFLLPNHQPSVRTMKKYVVACFLLPAILCQTHSYGQAGPVVPSPFPRPTVFHVQGRQLLDACGSPVVLKGVNKMVFFDRTDPEGAISFPQIALTGANCVRIVWQMKNDADSTPTSLDRLDRIIGNAKASRLIPMVGLWDHSGLPDGGFSKLSEYTDYWTRPEVVRLIRKHQAYLLINIADEAATGNELAAADVMTFDTTYQRAVAKMRKAGIAVPLVIDGMDRGKSLRCFVDKGPGMLRADSLHNLIFSFHPYWPKAETDSMEGGHFIENRFAEVRAMARPITLIMGEVSKYGAFVDSTSNPCLTPGVVDYRKLVQQAAAQDMGWLIWEWGPGNAFKTTQCTNMDMTTDRMFRSLFRIPATPPTTRPEDDRHWMKELAISNASYSIKSSVKTTSFINSGFKNCPSR